MTSHDDVTRPKAPALAPWLEVAAEQASTTFYDGKSALYQGEGGSIPFMGMLGKMYPTAQFLITARSFYFHLPVSMQMFHLPVPMQMY